MPRPKGLPKTGGRIKGTPNRRAIFAPATAVLRRMTATQLKSAIAQLEQTLGARIAAEQKALDGRAAVLGEAARAYYGADAELAVEIDESDNTLYLTVVKTVVPVDTGDPCEVSLDEVRKSIPDANLGNRLTWRISEGAFMAPPEELATSPGESNSAAAETHEILASDSFNHRT